MRSQDVEESQETFKLSATRQIFMPVLLDENINTINVSVVSVGEFEPMTPTPPPILDST